MTSSDQLTDVLLPELGTGAGIAVWGFRACARGGAGCCAVINGFAHAFGPMIGPVVLERMLDFARHVGHRGGRTVALAMPGCARLSGDELSILACLAAAQTGDRALTEAHLSWLMARPADEELTATVAEIASEFAGVGLHIDMPNVAVSRPRARRTVLSVVAGGRA